MDCAETMVKQNSLVIIEEARIARPLVKLPGQLQHVVHAAAFGSIYAFRQLKRKMLRRHLPEFSIAGSSGDVCSRLCNLIPEKPCNLATALIDAKFASPRRTNHL